MGQDSVIWGKRGRRKVVNFPGLCSTTSTMLKLIKEKDQFLNQVQPAKDPAIRRAGKMA